MSYDLRYVMLHLDALGFNAAIETPEVFDQTC